MSNFKYLKGGHFTELERNVHKPVSYSGHYQSIGSNITNIVSSNLDVKSFVKNIKALKPGYRITRIVLPVVPKVIFGKIEDAQKDLWAINSIKGKFNESDNVFQNKYVAINESYSKIAEENILYKQKLTDMITLQEQAILSEINK